MAEEKLGAASPTMRCPPEQRALQHLQRAEAAFREVQVAMGQQGGGGGAGCADAEDLADLFELELDRMRNQYETVQRNEAERQSQQSTRPPSGCASPHAASSRRSSGSVVSSRTCRAGRAAAPTSVSSLNRPTPSPASSSASPASSARPSSCRAPAACARPSSRCAAPPPATAPAPARPRWTASRRRAACSSKAATPASSGRSRTRCRGRAPARAAGAHRERCRTAQPGRPPRRTDAAAPGTQGRAPPPASRTSSADSTARRRVTRRPQGRVAHLQEAANAIRDTKLVDKVLWSRGVVQGAGPGPEYARMLEEQIGAGIAEGQGEHSRRRQHRSASRDRDRLVQALDCMREL